MEKAFEQLKENLDINAQQMEQLEEFASNYSNKSDKDIFFDIVELNKKLSKEMSPEQMDVMLQGIRGMLDDEQSKKLDKLLKMLNG